MIAAIVMALVHA